MTELEIAARLGVASLAGLAVGVEREWSGHATGPGARFAGVRTFFLLGLLGGLAGVLGIELHIALAVALLATAGALVVAAYLVAARRDPGAVDGTTETAALVVLALGAAAGFGWLQIASGAAAVMVLALGEKETIRAFVARIDEAEMRAALRFAVLALVVLPLLPAGPVAALGNFRPRSLWAVVLLFSGLSFLGFVARRAIGDGQGYVVAGALGGTVSSTAVTLNFARQSRSHPADGATLALGAIAASTVLVPRVLVLTLVLNPRLLPAAGLGLLPVFALGLTIVIASLRRVTGSPHSKPPGERNPLQLGAAIRLAVAFQIVLMLLDRVVGRFGEGGAYVGAAVLGLTDMDALTFAMNRLAADPAAVVTAGTALAVGVASNSVLKAGAALIVGRGAYRRLVPPVLLGFAALCGVGAWLTVSIFRGSPPSP